ncbi:MAG TPA: hypothetical protein VMU16_03630, partial [Candidatus Binataceae bacterium]|nr:hypothetical protein [Candidatus Binataceae bacterium]
MAQPEDHNTFDSMLSQRLRTGLDASGRACPDDDAIAAYVAHALAADEIARLERHVAECALCQRQVATLVRHGAIAAASASPMAPRIPAQAIETVDAEEARAEAGGLIESIRNFGRFMLGPFPLSVALHVGLLLVLIITVHAQRGRELIMVNLEAGGGGGGGNEMQDIDTPEVPMPEMASQQMEAPSAVDTSQAVSLASDYVRSAGGSGIGIGRGGGMGSGYGHGVGSGFGGFI